MARTDGADAGRSGGSRNRAGNWGNF
jgi:hypothetical protein